jgi:hypothetical protein
MNGIWRSPARKLKTAIRSRQRITISTPSITSDLCPLTQKGRNLMSFKFLVGQTVEYTPIGEKKAGLFKIVRQMPKEDQAIDAYYRIKSETEAHERNVLECQLSADAAADSSFAGITPGDNEGAKRDQEFHPDRSSQPPS